MENKEAHSMLGVRRAAASSVGRGIGEVWGGREGKGWLPWEGDRSQVPRGPGARWEMVPGRGNLKTRPAEQPDRGGCRA